METVTCQKCSASTHVKDLRADKSGRGWLCINCYNRQHNKVSLRDEPLPKIKTITPIKEERVVTNDPNLLSREIKKIGSYKCTACGYKFETSQGALNKQCPYCSRYGNIEKVKTAEEILQSVNNMPDF